jgi:hypothetical protein
MWSHGSGIGLDYENLRLVPPVRIMPIHAGREICTMVVGTASRYCFDGQFFRENSDDCR